MISNDLGIFLKIFKISGFMIILFIFKGFWGLVIGIFMGFLICCLIKMFLLILYIFFLFFEEGYNILVSMLVIESFIKLIKKKMN